MAESEEYDFEKLAREITSAQLKDNPEAPRAAAAIAVKIIASGVQSTRQRQDPRVTVRAVCRGTISGMLLIEKDLVATSVELLKSMSHLSQQVHLDPADMMTWAMEGIAAMMHMGPPDLRLHVREAIDENFMGAGEIFGTLCQQAGSSD